MTRTVYLIDTWAWIDYFQNPESEVAGYIDQDEHLVYTSILTITEIMTVFSRKQTRAAGRAAIGEVYRMSTVLPVDKNSAVTAGEYEKGTFGGGIADRIIRATAEIHGLVVVTGDQHFKELPGVAYLGK
jgi:predicted nucleic acid-binding protein